jgi:hypothetical protein
MTHTKAQNWKQWDKERDAFEARLPRGFTLDLQALQAHIARLLEIAPKDSAGRIETNAYIIIERLQKDYNRFSEYLKEPSLYRRPL